jgi:hypothetical protein
MAVATGLAKYMIHSSFSYRDFICSVVVQSLH